MDQKPVNSMTMDELRESFRNITTAVYGVKVDASTDEKLVCLKGAMGQDVRFAAYGGNETPDLELACLEYSYIMSKVDPVA